jgi:hypothetical protein
VDTDSKIRLIEDIRRRLLLHSHLDDPEVASEIARRWVR